MERIAQLAEADEFRTLTVIDLLRQDVKKSGASSVPLPYLFDALKMKLSGTSAKLRKPTEEVVLAVIQLLVECIHAAGMSAASAAAGAGAASTAESAARGAVSVFQEIMPFMPRDRVRRACGVLLSGALKRGGPKAGAEVARIIAGPAGIGNKDDVSAALMRGDDCFNARTIARGRRRCLAAINCDPQPYGEGHRSTRIVRISFFLASPCALPFDSSRNHVCRKPAAAPPWPSSATCTARRRKRLMCPSSSPQRPFASQRAASRPSRATQRSKRWVASPCSTARGTRRPSLRCLRRCTPLSLSTRTGFGRMQWGTLAQPLRPLRPLHPLLAQVQALAARQRLLEARAQHQAPLVHRARHKAPSHRPQWHQRALALVSPQLAWVWSESAPAPSAPRRLLQPRKPVLLPLLLPLALPLLLLLLPLALPRRMRCNRPHPHLLQPPCQARPPARCRGFPWAPLRSGTPLSFLQL